MSKQIVFARRQIVSPVVGLRDSLISEIALHSHYPGPRGISTGRNSGSADLRDFSEPKMSDL